MVSLVLALLPCSPTTYSLRLDRLTPRVSEDGNELIPGQTTRADLGEEL